MSAATPSFAPSLLRDITVNAGQVDANKTADISVTVKGAKKAMFMTVHIPSLEANLVVSHVLVSADDTVKVRPGNLTSSKIDPAEKTWTFLGF